MDPSIERVTGPTDEVRALIEALDHALSGRYLPSQRHALSIEQLFQPDVRFFVARVDGVAAGCGGVAFDDGFAEVKRMFTRAEWRRAGVARALLRHLEAEAQSGGYSTLRLETGCYQAAAMAFYEREGFLPCPAFGVYASLPLESVETSVFYEKAIT